MIVCICKQVRHHEVDRAIDAGARSVDEIGALCGAGTGCGRCRDYLHDRLDEAGVGCGSTGRACSDCPGRSLPLAG